MIRLGVFDSQGMTTDIGAYLRAIHEPAMMAARGEQFRGESDDDWRPPTPEPGRTVAHIQTFLKKAGFFPFGKIDGLCGYRTHSAIRLFQEYVRTVEGDITIGSPDGIFGQKSEAAMNRWRNEGKSADWLQFTSHDPQPEYSLWMRLLENAHRHFLAHPTLMLRKVGHFPSATDTQPVAGWNLDPGRIHLIGIRRNEAVPGKRVNDDVYVLLINGLVFKFFGTTDPGKADASATSAPFLVQGQHHYRFGWHKQSSMQRCYLALKPLRHGVLVIRSGERDDPDLTEADIVQGSLEANQSINVHWGGKGVSNWSVGCQVICGRGYINHRNEIIDCSSLAASRYADIGTTGSTGQRLTRGAYTTLVDLVASFSGEEHALSYMLLYERDLDLLPEIGAGRAREILERITGS